MNIKSVIVGVILLINGYRTAYSQRTVIVAEIIEPLTGAIECYTPKNDRMLQPSCRHRPDTVILVQGLYVGSKLVSTGCPLINTGQPFDKDVCCAPDYLDDCIFQYSYKYWTNQRYHLSCTGVPECTERMLTSWAPTICTDPIHTYMRETYYMFMDYACVDESRIYPINWTEPIQGMNDPVYFQTPGYPSNSTNDENFIIKCRAMASSIAVSVYTIDVRLSKNNGTCEERLSFSNGTEGFERSCNETLDDAFRVTRTDIEGSVEMVFESNATGNMGYVWIGFYGHELEINCTYERPLGHLPESTNTATSTPSSPTQPPLGGSSSHKNSGMTSWSIAMIVVAMILLLLLALTICLCCWYTKTKQKDKTVNPEVAGTKHEDGIISGRASIKSDFVTSVRAFKNSFVNTFTSSRSGKYAFTAPEPKDTPFRPGMTIKRGNPGYGISSMNGNSSLTSRYKLSTSSLGSPLPFIMSTPEDHEECDEKQGSIIDMSNYKLPCMTSLYLGQPTPEFGKSKQRPSEPKVDVREGPSYLKYGPSAPAQGHLLPIVAQLPHIGLVSSLNQAAEGQTVASGEVKERRKRKRKKRRRKRQTENAEQIHDDNAVDTSTYMDIQENKDY